MKLRFHCCVKKVFFIPLLFLLATGIALGQKLERLPPATHSEVGVECSQLVKVKEINSSYDDDILLARPISLTVDGSGNFFVYDGMLKSVAKFDKNFRYLTSFMRGGRGPGETAAGMGMEMGFYKIYYAPDSKIYVSDPLNNKVIVFSPAEGKHLKDIRLDKSGRLAFSPVVDSRGHLFAMNGMGRIIDELDINNNMKLVRTYLDDSLNDNFPIYRPGLDSRAPKQLARKIFAQSGLSFNYYDVTRDNQLLIFLANPSTLYIFKEDKLVLQMKIFIQSEMERMRDLALGEIERAKKDKYGRSGYISMFRSFFIDKDDDRYFYLCGNMDKMNLYKFSTVGGKLVKILSYSQKNLVILTKRNNLFYGFSGDNGNPIIFKEDNKK